jgi:DNA-binding PadR family transcriptional regulator
MAQLTGNFEEQVVIAILNLSNDTYSVPLRRKLEEELGRMVSIGALFTTIDRLEQKGFIESRQSEPIAERGGRARRYFCVTGTGIEALREKQTLEEQKLAVRGKALGQLGLRPSGGAA